MIIEGRIYKYVVPERINILEDLQLRITQPKYLNDLFDLSVSIKRLIKKETYDKRIEGTSFTNIFENIFASVNIDLNSELKKQGMKKGDLEKFIFTGEHKELSNGLNDEFNKMIGVLSFTELYDNVPMWAHYAGLYSGFVLIFDSTHKFFNKGLIDDKQMGYLEQVKYVKEKKGFDSVEEIYQNIPRIFYEKQNGWENEKEWRMILPLEMADEKKYQDIYLIDIPSDLILGIIFGFNCSNNLIEYVKELKKNNFNKLELYKAMPNLEKYRMDIVEF
jgi:hypothetical protein